MNLEQRNRVMQAIRQREGLLAWAIKNNDTSEVNRLKAELDELAKLMS